MSFGVWIAGVALIFAFLAGIRTETEVFTMAARIGFIGAGAWSIGVYLFTVGYSQGKRNR